MAHRPDPARRRIAFALGAAPMAYALGGCAVSAPPIATPTAPPTQQPPAPRVRVGDRWRYSEVNGFNGERIAEVTCEAVEVAPRVRIQLTDSRGRARADEVYTEPWLVVVEPFYDYPQTFETPVPILPEVLAAGAQSRITTAYRVPDASSRFGWQQYLDARGWQRIRVPAGEFDTLLVQRRIWFSHVDRWRLYPYRWDLAWYAPAVNRWVRREWSGEYRWAGVRRGAPLREEWIVWELAEYAPARA